MDTKKTYPVTPEFKRVAMRYLGVKSWNESNDLIMQLNKNEVEGKFFDDLLRLLNGEPLVGLYQTTQNTVNELLKMTDPQTDVNNLNQLSIEELIKKGKKEVTFE
jgi:hypothetical protein